MHCTECGTAVPDGAKFCPGCGASTVARPHGKRKLTDGELRSGCAALGVIGFLIFAATQCSDNGPGPSNVQQAALSPAEQKAASEKGAACEKALSGLEKTGLIKDRPEPNRIDVDEVNWALMPARDKRLVAAGVRCSFLNGRESDAFDDYAVVYGYRTGKRLAMATANGVELE
jgi:predicted RNA-binding Zn-ribbon protein involved in translation (DUF1610 family)